MLSKVETASSSMQVLASDGSLRANNTTQTRTTSYTFTQSMDTVYASASGSWWSSYAANFSGSITINLNNTTVYSWSWRNRSESMQHMEQMSVKAGDTVSIITTVSQWSGDSYYSEFSGTVQISGGNNAGMIRVLIPQEVVEIGEQGTATSYGRLPDGTRYGEFNEPVSSSATTGNITPGNFVGYLTVSDKNGNKYKIPYYGL